MKERCRLGCLAILVLQGATGSFARAADEQTPSADKEVTKRAGQADQGATMSEPPKVPPLPPEPLPGQLSSLFKVDTHNPEASVPTPKQRDADPLEYGYFIQDLLTFAEDARRTHDYLSVVAYYRAVAKAVPDNAKGWSKLCEAYEIVGDPDRAIRACKYALERPAVELQDYVRYVHLILGKTGPLPPEDLTAVKNVLAHLDQDTTLQTVASHLRCELGVRENDVGLLEACTAVLAKVAPDDPKTIVFQWNLALQKGQQKDAALLLDRAKKAGIVLANLERMEKMTWQRGRIWPGIVGLGALLGVVAIAWALRRRRTMLHRPAQ